jgi:dihydroorotase
VTPGLIDFHTHVYWGVSAISLDLAEVVPGSGVTTWVDAGSAGAFTFPGFRRYVMEKADVGVLAFLNISTRGVLHVTVVGGNPGDSDDIRWCDLARAVSTIEEHRDVIVGVKVRASLHPVREAGIEPVLIAREAADATGLPLMVHIGAVPPTLREILPVLQEGDILTHAFRGPVPSIVTREGTLRPDAQAAHERGVLFDIGHGGNSFHFDTARRLLDQGILPDIISTDLHELNWRGPVFDLATTLSKFLNLGLTLEQVVARTTANPAAALGRGGAMGSLREGMPGDVTLLRIEEGPITFRDATGGTLEGNRQVKVAGMIVGGRTHS